MKTILIPIDFTVDSLFILKSVLSTEKDEQVNIVLGYGKRLSWSITDLLFYSKENLNKKLENKDFFEAKEVIVNKFNSKIKSIKMEFFHGINQNAFENFISGNNINQAVIPSNDNALKTDKYDGFSIIPFIKKSSQLTVSEIELKRSSSIAEKGLYKLLIS